eukprot:TRINITY_DN20917_c0_g2_i1.p1 TRINITY_DN20917_c0_g2~~TRINITY_DN20917_c0_g2_i1.p1  ORF type:complete len:169 (+),score=27.72 TRINITY_DN20917_c0_g2_i1:72-578(+)
MLRAAARGWSASQFSAACRPLPCRGTRLPLSAVPCRRASGGAELKDSERTKREDKRDPLADFHPRPFAKVMLLITAAVGGSYWYHHGTRTHLVKESRKRLLDEKGENEDLSTVQGTGSKPHTFNTGDIVSDSTQDARRKRLVAEGLMPTGFGFPGYRKIPRAQPPDEL